MTVEVCWECDIADCRHIRERRAAETAHLAYSVGRCAGDRATTTAALSEARAEVEMLRKALTYIGLYAGTSKLTGNAAAQMAREAMDAQEARVAEWEDPRVQVVYNILCDSPMPPNPDEHWEGYQARLIVAALEAKHG